MTPEETVEAFFAAFTDGELERAAELVADDIVYDNIGIGPTSFDPVMPTIDSPQAMVEFVAQLHDIEWVIHRQFSSGNMVVNERRDKMTFHGAAIDLAVLGVFEVVDGKITVWRDYFDIGRMTDQMSGG